jgi:hypothetical protein
MEKALFYVVTRQDLGGFGSCQCETLRIYLPFNMYMICDLFILRSSFLSQCKIFQKALVK